MKNLKKITVWVLLSLSVQFVGLFYLDKFYFVTETTFKTKKVEEVKKNIPKDVKVKISEKAKNIKVSYDGQYVAYYENEVLKVVDMQTAEVKTVSFDKGVQVSFYKWLPDVNSMIIAEKQTSKQGDGLKFSSYDVDKAAKKEIKDYRNNVEVYIPLPDKKSEVQDIELSTLTNAIYIKVGHSGNRNSIYHINIMSQMEKVSTTSYIIGNIVVFPHEDRIAYEDSTYKKINVTGSTAVSALSIKGISKPSLIGTDSDDNLYVGQMEDDKITKIYYGQIKESTDKWKSVQIKDGAEAKDIYISEEGKIYVNDNLKGIIKELNSGMETAYRGQFLQMYNKGVTSISDGVLVDTNYK